MGGGEVTPDFPLPQPSVALAPAAQPPVADPSSGAARHLLPQGEKVERLTDVAASPSPLVGEGARRADEGFSPPSPTAARRPVAPRLRSFARYLRREATPHEEVLWHLLRGRRFVDFKFRRQVPVGPLIADFACHSAKLILELDGGQHAESQTDPRRDAVLRTHGYRILRIWNNELHENRDGVMEAIWLALQEGHP
ncbi:endonuclease domain-containing protein [Devosia sp. A16]|uniref:endonuclease domain-containing protein n=1 Tax=Devosia sp. A16 TaxID=1736675 RepID=UPI0009EC5CF9|nr:endonuclease domain-containing protein [Devosia sp. A16]